MSERVATVYPDDALEGRDDLDVIVPDIAPTLDALFRERVRRCPDKVAYTEFVPAANQWKHFTWNQMASEVDRWRAAFKAEGLQKGDRVALRLRNCRHWVIFDQAALSLGLVVVPLYVADRPDNVNYVLMHSDTKLLLVESSQAWHELKDAEGEPRELQRVVVLGPVEDGEDRLVQNAEAWIGGATQDVPPTVTQPEELASIVYTSGTTGRPKGVMLSHWNMVANAYSGLRSAVVAPTDVLLSFLPLSHTLERTVGYYVPVMAGAEIVYNRSIPELADDLLIIRPTGMITVPRTFERLYSKLKTQLEDGPAWEKRLFLAAVEIGWSRFEYAQRRAGWRWGFLLWPALDALVASKVRRQLGGRLQLVVVGGAPLPPSVSRVFIALGVPLLQGYGLTETSPSISINTLARNRPATIGLPLRDVEVKIGDDNELLARGPNVTMGYWKNEEATKQILDSDGWLHSGDQARIEADGFISITGRLKEILVLANGEKVSPADMESAIAEDVLFKQSMVIGEQMPYLSALVVLKRTLWKTEASKLGIGEDDESALTTEKVEQLILERIQQQMREFPGYARIRRVTATFEAWTVENGLLTPTLKLKRPKVHEHYKEDIERMYEGHETFKRAIPPN